MNDVAISIMIFIIGVIIDPEELYSGKVSKGSFKGTIITIYLIIFGFICALYASHTLHYLDEVLNLPSLLVIVLFPLLSGLFMYLGFSLIKLTRRLYTRINNIFMIYLCLSLR